MDVERPSGVKGAQTHFPGPENASVPFFACGFTNGCGILVSDGYVSMADNLLFFTELMGMPVLDLKGRRIGRVKDAALVPVVNSSRIDRFLVGGGDAG